MSGNTGSESRFNQAVPIRAPVLCCEPNKEKYGPIFSTYIIIIALGIFVHSRLHACSIDSRQCHIGNKKAYGGDDYQEHPHWPERRANAWGGIQLGS